MERVITYKVDNPLPRQKVRGFFDQVFNRANGRINQDALSMVQECDAMTSAMSSGAFSAGYYTSVVVLMHENRDKLDEAARAALKVIQKLGFTGRIESVNCLEAWLGSLPGNGVANVRRPLITTQNLGDLIPTSGIWTGDEYAPCKFYPPESPALMQCVTTGATPFRLNLHVKDVGHTVVLGPTGSGKSTLLGLIAVQALRYRNMQVFAFDKGRSMKCLCEAVEGKHYEIGGEVAVRDSNADSMLEAETVLPQAAKPLNFAPLANIGQSEAERQWAQTWIEDLLQLNGLTIISLTRNWKQNSASMAGNSYRMPFPKNIISYLQRWKWKNITLVYMPAKQMNIWSRQTIRRPCCTEVWYPHLWQLQSSTENM